MHFDFVVAGCVNHGLGFWSLCEYGSGYLINGWIHVMKANVLVVLHGLVRAQRLISRDSTLEHVFVSTSVCLPILPLLSFFLASTQACRDSAEREFPIQRK